MKAAAYALATMLSLTLTIEAAKIGDILAIVCLSTSTGLFFMLFNISINKK